MVKLRIYFFGGFFFFFFYHLRSALLSLTFWEKADPIRPGDAVQGGPGDPLFPGVFSLSLSLSTWGSTTVLIARSLARARLRALFCWSFLLRRSFWTLLWQKNFSNVLCVWESSACAVDLAEEASNSTSTPATSFSLSLLHAYAHKSLFPDLKNTVDPFVD
jgi:hypothetical protein